MWSPWSFAGPHPKQMLFGEWRSCTEISLAGVITSSPRIWAYRCGNESPTFPAHRAMVRMMRAIRSRIGTPASCDRRVLERRAVARAIDAGEQRRKQQHSRRQQERRAGVEELEGETGAGGGGGAREAAGGEAHAEVGALAIGRRGAREQSGYRRIREA